MTDDQLALDLAEFTTISGQVQQDYMPTGAADPWEASPFAWIRRESSRVRGAIGEKLVQAWALHQGLRVERAFDSGHDCLISGLKVEVKFSTLWKSGGFTFQQIRDQSYEVAALLGIEPTTVHLWFVPKPILWEQVKDRGQHTGADASDTKWLSFPAGAPPAWLGQYGGRLPAARAALERLTRKPT